MKYRSAKVLAVILYLQASYALADSYYCPEKHGYINTGMTMDQVLAACGEPRVRKTSEDTRVSARVPVKQLLYTELNHGHAFPGLVPAFYDNWSLPSGSHGIVLQFDIIDGKVDDMRMNNSSTNAITVCGGNPVTVGSNEVAIYNACGNPSMINYTWVERVIPSNKKPEVWIYRMDQYQPEVRLTFVEGILQIISR